MSLWQDKSVEERIAILQQISSESNLEELAIEKDWWVTITLKSLFSTSFAGFIFFKGGTSLSKGWKSTNLKRFSEDIDIALSRKWFLSDEVKDKYPFAECKNNNQIKLLRKASREVIFNDLSMELNNQLTSLGVKDFKVVNVMTEESAEGTKNIATDRDPVVINVEYQSILDSANEYIVPKVKIEISCLSMDDPFENRDITSLVFDKYPEEDNDSTSIIPAILPQRTFLEKSFLLNEEYQKKVPRSERMSRHLYDLEKLMDSFAGIALADCQLYDAIITHREKFYHISSVDYISDQRKNIHIWPNGDLEKEYENDYKAMVGSFIYDKNPISFSDLKNRIVHLEELFRTQE